ncbi:phage tail spike protein [Aeribacillus composti]|uniref:phage tail spike protein n=1 Tax=Aeribacillus composti TaxID=1868734 RepID=UPI002E244183|nr:phage tail spike protein [Aeribacillus composti]
MIHITDSQTDRILDFIQEEEFWEDKHYKSLKDTLETFDFVTFANKRFSEHLTKRNRIIIPDEDGKYVEFVIENTREYRDSNDGLFVEVYTSATYIELTKAKIIKPQTTPAWTPRQHADFALAGTGWEVGEVHFAGARSLTIEQHTNPYSYLKRVSTETDLELHFRVETDGSKVVRRYADLVERVGTWNGREVEFGKDLIEIERKEDFSNIATALLVIGPEREDGTRLEVFVEDKDALARWGRNNQHIIDVYEPESTDQSVTEDKLRELGETELKKRVNSVVEYTADISDLEKVPGLEHEKIRFGDTIKIKDTGFEPALYLEARLHTMERSIKKNGYKTVTLGDYIEYTEEQVFAIWKALQAEIAKKVSLTEVKEVVYTKQEVDEKDNTVKEVAAQDATNKANQAEENSKQYVDVREVYIKEYADQQAQQAEQRAVTQAESIAEQKKQLAIQAAIADAEQKVNQAKTELENELATKVDAQWVNGQLVTKADKDNTYTKTEVDTALNSKVSVTTYTVDKNGIISRLDSAESRITQNENEIATKVSNTQYQQDKAALENDISALETRMTNAETSITQTANQIALKANATDVYTKSQIDGQFSTVNQQISQLNAELSVQAGEIATKVSKTEFESLQIGGRNLIKNSGNYKTLGNWTANGSGTSITLTQKDGFSVLEGIKSITGENVYGIKNNTEYVFSAEVMFDRDVNITSNTPLHCHVAISGDSHGGKETISLISKDTVVKANTWSVISVKIKTKSDVTITHFKPYIYGLADGTKFWVKWWKLEEGNKPTAWTPAPEDVQGQIDGLGTRVNSAETSITQLANQISLKANQTTVDTLGNQISSAQSQINLLSDQIQLKVDKNGVISAINVSSEGVRISGNKVTIDGTTNIANGVIKTAHIESLTFDKLRGGTATLGGSGNNGSLEVLGADNSVIFRASRDGLVGSGGQPIITKNGLISSFAFVSSGDVNGWQRCGWWDYGGVGQYEQAYIRFRIPVNFTVTNAAIYVYSMPVYISGHPGITTGYYHTRYIKLFKINDITNQFFDMPFASDNYGIVVRSGSATDISNTVWGKSRWDPQVEGTVSRIQVIGGGITSLVDPGYNEFFVKSDSAIQDQRNSSLIQIMVIIEGYQSR